MQQFHAPLEMSRCQSDKSHTVAVLWVHIGLHLKDKARHFGFFWGDLTGFGGLDLRLWSVFSDAIHQFFDAKGIDGRSKPNGGHVPF